MKYTALLLFLSFYININSQENYNSESYRVTIGDIESKTFSKDSTANALVIYEKAKSYVDKSDFDLRTEEKHKIKILKREGFEHATVEIHLYSNGSRVEKVEKILATTYTIIDGEVIKTKLDEENIFTEKYDENHTLVKFTLPNVKVGSVISYSYTIISPFMMKYHGWDFQGSIPKLYSEYRPSIPGNWEYNIKLVGGQKLAINESEVEKNCLIASNGASSHCFNARYVMKDIPAFIEEDYMTSKSNYLIKIEYDLKTFRRFDGTLDHITKTWKTVDKELKTHPKIGKQLNKSVDLEEFLSEDIINETDLLKKAQSIFKYVQNNYNWDEEYLIFSETSVKDLIKSKSGNVASINILLHNLLDKSGIEVNPVLVSTRGNGFPTKVFPVLYDFNYLIVQVTINDKKFMLDATDNFLNFGEIPFKCLNQYGRLIDFKNGSNWVDLKPYKPSNIFYQANLHFNENGDLIGDIKSKRTGYHAFYKKKSFYSNKNEYLDKLENTFPYIGISDFDVTSEGKNSEDFKEAYNVEYNFDEAGNNIYLNPFLVKFFDENPFKLQERTYPIDFGYKDSYFYMFKFELNDNYKIIEMPQPKNVMLPNGSGQILFNATQIGNTVNVSLKIAFKKSIYNAEYYTYLKEFMNEVVNIQNNTIILVQKTN